MITLGEVYSILVAKNKEDPDNSQAWIDAEANAIWMLGEENVLVRYTSTKKPLKDMSEQEIKELVAFMAAMDEEF